MSRLSASNKDVIFVAIWLVSNIPFNAIDVNGEHCKENVPLFTCHSLLYTVVYKRRPFACVCRHWERRENRLVIFADILTEWYVGVQFYNGRGFTGEDLEFSKKGPSQWIWGQNSQSGIPEKSRRRESGGRSWSKNVKLCTIFKGFLVQNLGFHDYRRRAWTVFCANTHLKNFWTFSWGLNLPNLPLGTPLVCYKYKYILKTEIDGWNRAAGKSVSMQQRLCDSCFLICSTVRVWWSVLTPGSAVIASSGDSQTTHVSVRHLYYVLWPPMTTPCLR